MKCSLLVQYSRHLLLFHYLISQFLVFGSEFYYQYFLLAFILYRWFLFFTFWECNFVISFTPSILTVSRFKSRFRTIDRGDQEILGRTGQVLRWGFAELRDWKDRKIDSELTWLAYLAATPGFVYLIWVLHPDYLCR